MFPNGAFCFDIGSVDVAIGFHLFTDEACFFDVREVSVDIGANITRNHLFSVPRMRGGGAYLMDQRIQKT